MTDNHILDRPSRWDLSNVYSGLEGDDYRGAFALLEDQLAQTEQLFDRYGVRRLTSADRTAAMAPGEQEPFVLPRDLEAEPPAPQHALEASRPVDNKLAVRLEEVLSAVNSLWRLADTLDAFVHAFVTTDSYDAAAQREASKLELLGVRRQRLVVRLQGWIGSLADRLPELVTQSPTLAAHAYFLNRTARESRYLMSEELESLAAELTVDGGAAFGKLQGNITSQLKVPLERNGRVEVLPITVVRNLSFDPDPEVREAAYRAEIQGWESIRTTVAACLNGVKGTALTLARRRGRPSVLDAALEDNRIGRPTLEALLGSIEEAFPVFRRYLKSKAVRLGKKRLAWWDLFAPIGAGERKFTWREARDFLVDKFSAFSPELGEFAAAAFDHRWIDGEPRDGKRGGAFCMAVPGVEESRILANFDGSFEQVSTLAHELGHGFHNWCQRGLEPLRRGAPSTLAETASIFCETLGAEAALGEASPTEQLMILETQLAGATQVCLDISSRYLFESAFLERRAQCELSPVEICKLMLDAQRRTYADALDETTYHPYMWLWKPHYYAHDHNFYNFPYAFGHLFGLGLYGVYLREGPAFVGRYNELLRATGQDDAAPLAARFGIDITGRDFWRGSLALVAEQVNRYEALPPAGTRT